MAQSLRTLTEVARDSQITGTDRVYAAGAGGQPAIGATITLDLALYDTFVLTLDTNATAITLACSLPPGPGGVRIARILIRQHASSPKTSPTWANVLRWDGYAEIAPVIPAVNGALVAIQAAFITGTGYLLSSGDLRFDPATQVELDAETATRISQDTATLASAVAYADGGDSTTLGSAHTYTDASISSEVTRADLAYAPKSSDWTTGRAYVVGQLVVNSGAIYRCISAHTAGGAFDASKFTAVAGGSGAVASVEGRVGAVTLADLYQSVVNGDPQPFHVASIGASPIYTPDLTTGNRHVITTSANPSINMPSVPNDAHVRGWLLRLVMGGTGNQGDPTWDIKVTWRGVKSARDQVAGHYDMYWFETEDNTTWWGYHLSAIFAHGQNYDDWVKLGGSPAAPIAANTYRQYVDSDGVMKIKETGGDIHHTQIHVGTTAPTNIAMVWMDTS